MPAPHPKRSSCCSQSKRLLLKKLPCTPMLTLREQDLSKGIVMKFSSFRLLCAASSFAAACVAGCSSNDGIDVPENIGASVQPELSVYIGDSSFPSSPHCFEYDNHTVCGDDVVLDVGPAGGSANPSDWG